MMDPAGGNADAIAIVTWILIAVSGVVVVLVAAALVWTWVRARRTTDEVLVTPADGEQPVRWLGAYIPAVILAATFGLGLFLLLDGLSRLLVAGLRGDLEVPLAALLAGFELAAGLGLLWRRARIEAAA